MTKRPHKPNTEPLEAMRETEILGRISDVLAMIDGLSDSEARRTLLRRLAAMAAQAAMKDFTLDDIPQSSLDDLWATADDGPEPKFVMPLEAMDPFAEPDDPKLMEEISAEVREVRRARAAKRHS